MYEEVISKILESIDEKSILTEAYPKFSGEGYRAHKIDAKNFHGLNPSMNNKKIAFIDGGNAEIIGSGSFSLSLIRVCYAIYQNNKKILTKKLEFFCFTHAVNKNNEIYYAASFFNINGSMDLGEISFTSFDPTLMHGMNRAAINNVPSAIRRFAELKLAKLASSNKLADIIVLDGSLQGTLTNENKYLNELYDSCTENNVILTALSKTTSLFTDNGNLLSAVLGSIAKLPIWFYYPVAEISNHNHKAEMFFVKFHSKSRHVFRLEIFNIQRLNAEESINELASNCIDPVFIGYPYGLVEADRVARVSNQEREMIKTMILVKLRNKNVEKYLNASNAHEILDKISF